MEGEAEEGRKGGGGEEKEGRWRGGKRKAEGRRKGIVLKIESDIFFLFKSLSENDRSASFGLGNSGNGTTVHTVHCSIFSLRRFSHRLSNYF